MNLAFALALLISAAPPQAKPAPSNPASKADGAKAGAAKPASAKASAQTPGKPVIALTPPAKKATPEQFKKAMSDYFGHEPVDAARELFAYVEGSSKTDENHAWAQYFLARSLIDLGLNDAGAYYLTRVARERSNPQVLPRALEALHQLTSIPHDERMIDQQIFGSLDLGFLPPDVEQYVDFEQGMYDLRVGNMRWAETHFSHLKKGTPEYARARFSVLVQDLKGMKTPDPKIIDAFSKLAESDELTPKARNEAMMAVARLRYETKDYKGALKAYSQVKLPKLDPGRATLYLEVAWTRYRLGQVRDAMGLLTTLDAPSFRDEFLPDKYLLKAMIYRDLCQYIASKRSARALLRHFADSLEAIHERDDLTRDPRLRRAASAVGPTHEAKLFLDSLKREGADLAGHASGFGNRLFDHLEQFYSLAAAEAQRELQQRLQDSVRDVANQLLNAAEQERLLEYETGLKLYARHPKRAKLVISKKTPPLKPGQVAFPFHGEYWNDELRDYRVSIQSRCVVEDAQ